MDAQTTVTMIVSGEIGVAALPDTIKVVNAHPYRGYSSPPCDNCPIRGHCKTDKGCRAFSTYYHNNWFRTKDRRTT